MYSPAKQIKRMISFQAKFTNHQKYDFSTKRISYQNQQKVYQQKKIQIEIEKCIIYPNTMTYFVIFFIQKVILIYNTIITPIFMAFSFQPDIHRRFEICEYALNLLFFIIMIANFTTACIDHQGKFIYKRKYIILNYLKGWFIIDLISLIPYHPFQSFNFSIIRIFRILQAQNILNLFFLTTIQSKLHEFIADSKVKIKKFLKFLGYFHLLICSWIALGNLQITNNQGWIHYYQYQSSTYFQIYINAAYFIIETVSTIGYGDIVPTNTPEYIFVIILIHIGAVTYSIIIGYVIGSIKNLSQKRQQLLLQQRTQIEQKKNYVDQLDYLFQLSSQTKTYIYKKIKQIIKCQDENNQKCAQKDFLLKLPIDLRSKLSYQLNKSSIKQIDYFHNCDHFFVGELFLYLQQIHFQKNQIIFRKYDPADCMYLIKSGKVEIYISDEYRLNEPEPSWIIGETDMIFSERRSYEYRAKQDTILLCLSKKQYQKIFNYNFVEEGALLIKNALIKVEKIQIQLDQLRREDSPLNLKHLESRVNQHKISEFHLLNLIKELKMIQNKVKSFKYRFYY